MVKIAAIAVMASVLCVLLREREKVLAVSLSVLACGTVLLLGLRFLEPVLDTVRRLETLSGLSDSVTEPLLKVVGVGLVTQTATGVCAEAGEAALGKAVELTGVILSVCVSLPLLNAVLSLVEELMGGAG